MRAYSDNGLSMRAWDQPGDLLPGEVYFDHVPTDAEILAAFPGYAAALAAAQAAAKPHPTPREWLERLPGDRQQALTDAVFTAGGAARLWFLKACGTTDIDVASPECVAGVGALVALAILTSDEAATLLAP